MRSSSTVLWAVCAGMTAAGLMSAMSAGAAAPMPPTQRPVVAVVGETGLNVLHAEFRTTDGRTPIYPASMPSPVMISLPTTGTFAERMLALRAGPLGQPRPGTLYGLRGTRLLVYVPKGEDDVLDDRAHGTGVSATVAGRRTGSAPEALLVFVPGVQTPSYAWVASQSWIDVATTSTYSVRTTDQCAGAAEIRRLHAAGGLMFSSSGNTTDLAEPLSMPNGLPEVYQVGGVDKSGRTYAPPHPEEPQPFFAIANVVRPYESGARFSFPAASGDSLDGTQPFGGTSGATPTVAGYAAQLILQARRVLQDTGQRSPTALATARKGTPRPSHGPLTDGIFTRDELVALLHATARPAEAPTPARYLVEGYGATTATSHATALSVLAGHTAALVRPDDDARHAEVENVRANHSRRC